MIVACPACSTRYRLDPRALGAAGRRVRCARCGHVWHETPAPPPLVVEPALRAPPPPLSRGFAGGGEAPAAALSEPPPRRRSWRPAIAGALFALALVGLAVAAVAEREAVARLWPPAARLYALAGLPPALPGSGLELRAVTPSRTVEDGVPTLVIEGEVVNVSDAARPVPRLRAALRDGEDRELRSWTFAATDQPLAPGASVHFRTSLAAPSEAATGILVTFAGTGDQGP